uniref:Uncharacterized protein n=1 Tax=Neobodo designis TaxID=312471 RepID=A0A7S1M5T2_NEODS
MAQSSLSDGPISQAFVATVDATASGEGADHGQRSTVTFAPAVTTLGDVSPRDAAAIVELTDKPLDLGRLTQLALHPMCGGVSTFLGTTRDHHGGQQVLRLEYEAYVPMAVREMAKIAKGVFTRFEQVHRVVVAHRLGTVPVTESSVVIIVASEHRASGLAAVSWAIDELKTTVPIWKLEVYADATAESGEGVRRPQCCEHKAKWKSNPEFLARFAAAGGAAADLPALPEPKAQRHRAE